MFEDEVLKNPFSTPSLYLMYFLCEYAYYKILFSNWNTTSLRSLLRIKDEARLFFERLNEEEEGGDETVTLC